MICPSCGQEESGKFCSNCGTPLNTELQAGDSARKEEVNTPDVQPQVKESNLIDNYHQTYGGGVKADKPVTVKKPVYKRWWFYVLIVFVLIGIAGIAGGGGDETPASDSVQQDETATTPEEEPASEPASETEPAPEPEPAPAPEPEAVFNPVDFQTGVTYDNLARTPDDYMNSKVAFNGEVVQLIEGDGETQCRLAVEGNYDNMLYIGYDPSILDTRVLEGDYITIYGYSIGIISYESTIGGTISIPAVLVEKLFIN